MTHSFDKLFVSIGVDAGELESVKARWVIYAGLAMMAVAAAALFYAIAVNLLGDAAF